MLHSWAQFSGGGPSLGVIHLEKPEVTLVEVMPWNIWAGSKNSLQNQNTCKNALELW